MTVYQRGADPEALRRSGATMARYAGTLQAIAKAADEAIAVLAIRWEGPDAGKLVGQWRSTTRPALQRAHGHLASMSDRLVANADAQHRTSQGDGARWYAPGVAGPAYAGPKEAWTPGHPLPDPPPLAPTPSDPRDPNSFSGASRGTTPRRDDLALWKCAWNAYSGDNVGEHLPPGYARLSNAELAALGLDPTLFVDPASGMQAYLVKGPDGYVLAFEGTHTGQEWRNNWDQSQGGLPQEYRQAVALAMAVRDNPAVGTNLVLTGHSLGGGLAVAGASATGLTAVTFDAAAVHPTNLAYFATLGGRDPAAAVADLTAGQVRAYNVSTDPLTKLQDLPAILLPGRVETLHIPGGTTTIPMATVTAMDAPSVVGTRISLDIPVSDWPAVYANAAGRGAGFAAAGADVGARVGGGVGTAAGLLTGGPLGGLVGEKAGSFVGQAIGVGVARDLGTAGALALHGHDYLPMDLALTAELGG